MTFLKEYSLMSTEYKSELHNIGLKYNCDKCTVKCFCCPVKKQCNKKTSYLYNYEKHMKKNSKINLLEIGVRDGASIKVWNEYFSKDSKIYGIDIDPNCNMCSDLENATIFIGDCNDVLSVNKIKKLNLSFNCIIDDGSHHYDDITKSLHYYYPLLSVKGIYIIEDLASMNRISNKTYTDLKDFIKNNFKDYIINEYPETIVIEKK